MSNTHFVPLRTAALCACLLSSALLTGCGGGSSSASSNNSVTSASRVSNGLQFTLSANKSRYTVGEAIQLTLAVKNAGTQTATIAGTAGQGSPDIIQALQNNQVVWTSPQVMAAGVSAVANPFYTIVAGQTITLSETWSQVSDVTGQQVAPGTYTVQASFITTSINGVTFTTVQAQSTLNANPIQITIQH